MKRTRSCGEGEVKEERRIHNDVNKKKKKKKNGTGVFQVENVMKSKRGQGGFM